MQHNHVLKKLNFDLSTLGYGGLWAYICYLVATFCDSNKFDTQLNHVLKKLNFDPKVKWVGGGGGGLWPKYLLPCCYRS